MWRNALLDEPPLNVRARLCVTAAPLAGAALGARTSIAHGERGGGLAVF
jgi:hypothetical protein